MGSIRHSWSDLWYQVFSSLYRWHIEHFPLWLNRHVLATVCGVKIYRIFHCTTPLIFLFYTYGTPSRIILKVLVALRYLDRKLTFKKQYIIINLKNYDGKSSKLECPKESRVR